MDVTWQVLLSYDAGDNLYELKNEKYDFSKIQKVTNDFRMSLVVLLLDNGVDADSMKSYVKSTFLFNITLEQGKNPVDYLGEIFEVNFKPGDFAYMIHATVNQNNYKTFGTNYDLKFHNPQFELLVDEAKKLLLLIKKA
jgi:hypothetical protein